MTVSPEKTEEDRNITVKPLEWAGDPAITIYAASIVGTYRIDPHTPLWTWCLPGTVDRGAFCETIDAAKAAAQADYEARIMGALR